MDFSPQSRSRNRNTWSKSGPILGFVGGVVSVIGIQLLLPGSGPSGSGSISNVSTFQHYARSIAELFERAAAFPGDIGSTTVHNWPAASPTNYDPANFPTEVGYPGSTQTGAEAELILTAPSYPNWSGTPGLVKPAQLADGDSNPSWAEGDLPENSPFNLFQSWGNLSPFYSVPKDSFGLGEATPDIPSGCELSGVHILHRHGARYPAGGGYASPSVLAGRLHNATIQSPVKGTGPLSFLNTWTYKLGSQLLTPFGRQQMFDLGVSMRMKYGAILDQFADKVPVFRTESQDRMLASEVNFAFGFFGWPLEGKYDLSVTIEAAGFNNTLAPYMVCNNSNVEDRAYRGDYYVQQWVNTYLADAVPRIQSYIEGYNVTVEDAYAMQFTCAYETNALGYSSFCPLFTQLEWEGFQYALDLGFWYDSGFGSPIARSMGSGYVLELISRLTHTPVTNATSNPNGYSSPTFSINKTLDLDPKSFPLDFPFYVDATHETVMINIQTALNLSVLAQDGPPSGTKMKRDRKYISSRFASFGNNMQFQLLSCPSASSGSGSSSSPQIRIILNDGVVSLSNLEGCPDDKDGLCPLSSFVGAQKKMLEGTDWDWTCNGNWTVPQGDAWITTSGEPPAKP